MPRPTSQLLIWRAQDLSPKHGSVLASGLLGRGWRALHRVGEATEGAVVPAYPASCDSPIWVHYSHQDLQAGFPCSFGNPHELLHSVKAGLGRERGTPRVGNYVHACFHEAGSLCLFMPGLDCDHFWPPGGHYYRRSTESCSFLPRAAVTASVGGRERGGKCDEESM